MKSLQEQIGLELKKLHSPDDAFAWLTTPQPLLGWRIPARMIATGDAIAVLQALRSGDTP